jgi:phosphatidylethanolamine/phosphatidyl-N-methylethanolamine N-methyltransferase
MESEMMKTWTYIKNLIRDPYIASITPTSAIAVQKVCEKINFDSCRLIIEYGPGMGVFTAHLLKNMRRDARLIAIERNKNFYQILRRDLPDPRLTVLHDCAENVLDILKSFQEKKADYIISGIPFSFLPIGKKVEILTSAHSALKEGGKFLAYQNFVQTPEILKKHLGKIFAKLHTQYFFLCLPPLLIFEAVKENGDLSHLHH